MPKKITATDFLHNATKKHGQRYDYSSMQYRGMVPKISIMCEIHGVFYQSPDSHLRGHGCPTCAYTFDRYVNTRHTTERFIEKATRIHGNKYDYTNTTYRGDSHPITAKCLIHGDFTTKATSHLRGTGCQKCAGKYKRSAQEYVAEAKLVHGDLYDYTSTYFVVTKENITIVCKKHGEFTQNPNVHLAGGGCPKCRTVSYSKVSTDWLTHIEQRDNITIQHAESGGEYTIPNTRLRVDGFCEKTNTIYEFYGDIFHGNPKLYEPHEHCCKYIDKTANELYTKTINKEQHIKSHGYHLVTMWESDWNMMRKNNNNEKETHKNSCI